MRIGMIIAGIVFTILLWCGVGVYIAAQNSPPMTEYVRITLIAAGISLVIGFLANLFYGYIIKLEPDPKANSQAEFSAVAWKYYIFSLASGLAAALSLGVLKPFADEYFLRWKWKHTVLGGQVLSFTARGDEIFFKNLLWILITIVTFGVYSFWRRAKILSWQAEGLPSGVYMGCGKDFLIFFLKLIGIAVLIFVFSFFAVLILQRFRNLSMLKFFAFIFGVAILIMYVYLYSYMLNRNLDLTWNRFVVQGASVISNFEFPKPVLFIFQIIFSFGIALFIYPYHFERNIIRATVWSPKVDRTDMKQKIT